MGFERLVNRLLETSMAHQCGVSAASPTQELRGYLGGQGLVFLFCSIILMATASELR